MEDTRELLCDIVKTCRMGHNTLLQLVDITQNAGFASSLRIQLKAYDIVLNEAVVLLQQKEFDIPKQNELIKMSTFLNIKFSTLANKSTRHIADMVLQGTNMGIIEMTKAKKDYTNAEETTIALAQKLVDMQERNIEELKAFL